MENHVDPKVGEQTALSGAPQDVHASLVRIDTIKEKHLWDAPGLTWGSDESFAERQGKHSPELGARLMLSCEITFRDGVPAHPQGDGCAGRWGI